MEQVAQRDLLAAGLFFELGADRVAQSELDHLRRSVAVRRSLAIRRSVAVAEPAGEGGHGSGPAPGAEAAGVVDAGFA